MIVGWDKLKESQKELNGHVSMMLKIFKVGDRWEHSDRIRESMLGDSLTVCPITLLYKDHKGWDMKMGTIPPTRHVAGGHVGMNVHISELVSDIVEPLAGTIEGGAEIISSEDMVAEVLELNKGMEGWYVPGMVLKRGDTWHVVNVLEIRIGRSTWMILNGANARNHWLRTSTQLRAINLEKLKGKYCRI